MQRVETRDEATERVTEIFDTTQPPDSTTGTPPLAARIRERQEAKSRSDSRAAVETAKSDSTAADIKAAASTDTAEATQTEAETSGESETENREKRGTSVGVTIAATLGGLLIAGFFIWLLATVAGAIIKHRSNNS